MPKINLLDCTFRDGGYYNQWAFPSDLVSRYLDAARSSRIDVLELGFRFLPQRGFLGAYAYTSDELLKTLALPERAVIAVMINAKELLSYPGGPEAATDYLFNPAESSPVKMVRIASHFGELSGCRTIAKRLRQKGYRVGLNLMQADGRTADELASSAAAVADWDSVEVLYFADSLGSMDTHMVTSTVRAFQKGWKGPIGVHTHNNMGQALANSMAAVEAGAKWVDATMTGMGRGAGNANTECLMLELNRQGLGDFPAESIFALALRDFEPMRKHHGWGPNILYFLSAAYGIHPTYVQELLGKGQYDADHLIEAMDCLRNPGARGYSKARMDTLLSDSGDGRGTWDASDWARNQTVLIVAPGRGTSQHVEALCRFIERKKPVVVCLNVNGAFPPEKVTAYAACHKTCIALDAKKYRSAGRPLIAPLGAIPEKVRGLLGETRVLDYGMSIKPDSFSVRPDGCVVPSAVVSAYILGLAEASGARSILLAGFDGYGPSDSRHWEMNDILRCYRSRGEALPLLAVTPTSYDVPQGSIYSPDL